MICEVSYCPAEAQPGMTLCRIHRFARLAKGIALLDHKHCDQCGRKVAETDWIIERYTTEDTVRHVACEPKRAQPRRVRKADPKPLFEDQP